MLSVRSGTLKPWTTCGATVRDPRPPDHNPVFQEFCSGSIARKLAMVRDERERILADYDATVFKARQAGMSWGEIGRRLGVSRQQLHRSYAGRCMPEEPI